MMAVAVLATVLSLSSKPTQEESEGIVLLGSTSGTFAIKGNVSGLYPGQVTKLALRLVNPNGFAIKVTSVAVKVRSASAACSYTNVSVAKFAGSLKVRPHSSRRLYLALTMRRSAPDACQGKSFPLAYRGTAVKA
jgi:hypothetical protein